LPKKTIKIIIDSGNDYIVRVKGNQPNLYTQIVENTALNEEAIDYFERTIKIRGRTETRKIYIYDNIQGIDTGWIGIKRLIKVERIRVNHGHIHQVTGYYICSYVLDEAKLMYDYIKDVWGIENRLHWVKDVIMKEDTSKTAKGMAAQNISVMRNIAINIYRASGMDSIKYATQKYANNVKELMKLIKKASKQKRI